uniref:Uncharacterized protein n=1 Tax=Spongospora subterranea TaxID=70186 RepID=A0A0H5QFX2_9EUKA|eukprot:CRZ00834.1 hypothetical protein [Spongospora subterranea]
MMPDSVPIQILSSKKFLLQSGYCWISRGYACRCETTNPTTVMHIEKKTIPLPLNEFLHRPPALVVDGPDFSHVVLQFGNLSADSWMGEPQSSCCISNEDALPPR